MTNYAIPVPETQIGLAFETTRGTAVEPLYWTPVMGPKYKPGLELLPDEGLRGSMVEIYDEVPSLRADGHGWDTYLYMDSFPMYLKALLGPDHKTVAPTSTTLHEAAAAGAEKIKTEATIAAGSWIVLGATAGTIETHLTKAVTGAGPYEVELEWPLAYEHASAATVTGLTKHKFSLLNNAPTEGNQPKSVSITDYDGEENWRVLTASQLDSLSISGTADSLPKASVAWMGNAATTPAEGSPSFTEVEAPPGWTTVCIIGGTRIENLENWSFDFKRNVKNVPGITGTQKYFQHYAGALVPTAKFTVIQNRASTLLNKFLEGAQLSVELTLFDIKSGYALNFHSAKAKFTTGEIDRSKEWVEVPLDVQLLPSSTDALSGGVSPVAITAANAVTAEY